MKKNVLHVQIGKVVMIVITQMEKNIAKNVLMAII